MLRSMKPIIIACCTLAIAMQSAAAMDFKAKQMMLYDYTTGSVLMEHNADERMYPSSMSKLMTLYILFNRIKMQSIGLVDTLPVSEKAWKKGGSKMFVKVGDKVKVNDLIRGIIVQSGNDACIVVAEGISGTEEGFAKLMNKTAESIGLTSSHFTNSTGWPDEQHYMTARDLLTLTERILLDTHEFYPFFRQESFTYSGITQPNRNGLIGGELGVDGLKTGHTEAAGYGIVLSALKDGRRMILVLNGLESEKARLKEGELLLGHGFRDYKMVLMIEKDMEVAEASVWNGEDDFVPLTVPQAEYATMPLDEPEKMQFIVKYEGPVPAPIKKGDKVATMHVINNGLKMKEFPLVAAKDVGEAGFFKRFGLSLSHTLGL